jgi:hypothetical protein
MKKGYWVNIKLQDLTPNRQLESPGYEGHSLSTLRRVAEALHARVRVVFEPQGKGTGMRVAEPHTTYRTRTKRAKSKGV